MKTTFKKQIKLEEETKINLKTDNGNKEIMEPLKFTVWCVRKRYNNKFFFKIKQFLHHVIQFKKDILCLSHQTKVSVVCEEGIKTSFL